MNTQTMTLNQIAGLTGKTERSIRLWINKPSEKTSDISEKTSETSGKMSEIRSKISEARKTSKAAQFTLEETIEIIKAGGNETLANLLLSITDEAAGNIRSTLLIQQHKGNPSASFLLRRLP